MDVTVLTAEQHPSPPSAIPNSAAAETCNNFEKNVRRAGRSGVASWQIPALAKWRRDWQRMAGPQNCEPVLQRCGG